mmetsp:Transcript_53614/g.124771  ORF Transcript_53614/g.124771 Transcript_53614/m.124771 type:complete len:270 (+) Transcript_53614:2587-3396(+)
MLQEHLVHEAVLRLPTPERWCLARTTLYFLLGTGVALVPTIRRDRRTGDAIQPGLGGQHRGRPSRPQHLDGFIRSLWRVPRRPVQVEQGKDCAWEDQARHRQQEARPLGLGDPAPSVKLHGSTHRHLVLLLPASHLPLGHMLVPSYVKPAILRIRPWLREFDLLDLRLGGLEALLQQLILFLVVVVCIAKRSELLRLHVCLGVRSPSDGDCPVLGDLALLGAVRDLSAAPRSIDNVALAGFGRFTGSAGISHCGVSIHECACDLKAGLH